MQNLSYPPDTGSLAHASREEKNKRLDAMVRIWQSDTENRYHKEDRLAFIVSMGLDEYRYSVWLRFPEWDRSAVVGQVITLPASSAGEQQKPVLLSQWRHDPFLQQMPDWKRNLPKENVFNVSVRITPGSLGEGSKWAVIMPKDMIPRYRPGWPTQQEWVSWTRSFDWLSVGIGFIHSLLK